jgi:hypothetical protein
VPNHCVVMVKCYLFTLVQLHRNEIVGVIFTLVRAEEDLGSTFSLWVATFGNSQELGKEIF